MPHSLNPMMPKDYLRPCLLLLLHEAPSHGYDLLERLNELGFDASDPGHLYRGLRKLESEGLVRSAWERSISGPRRRRYTLTDRGFAELEGRARELADVERRIEVFLKRYLTARRSVARGVALNRQAGAADTNGASPDRSSANGNGAQPPVIPAPPARGRSRPSPGA